MPNLFRSNGLLPAALVLLCACVCPAHGSEPKLPASLPMLYRVMVEKKFGFIDRSGDVVIPLDYDWVDEFSDGVSQVRKNGKTGYIDQTGKWLFDAEKTHDIRPFRCGVAINYTGDGRKAIVDRSGKFIPCPYDWMYEFSEDLSAVYIIPDEVKRKPHDGFFGPVHAKYGFADKSGKLVIPTKFISAGSFHEGLAAVYVGGADTGDTGLRGGKWGYIDKSGEMVIEPQFSSAHEFSEGLAAVTFDGINYGWIDRNGKFAIKMHRLTMAHDFHEGLAWIRGATDSVPGWRDFGFITKDGKFLLHPNFRNGGDRFSEGLLNTAPEPVWNAEKGVWVPGLHGYVNERGEWVIPPQFDSAQPFRGGLAYVMRGKERNYIDQTGKIVWPKAVKP